MDISEAFNSLFGSEPATSVPLVHEAKTGFSQKTGIGDTGVVAPVDKRNIDIPQAINVPREIPTPEEMMKMSFFELNKLRDKYSGNHAAQNFIAPYEHRAMNREIVQEGGLLQNFLSAASLSVATPAYAALKAEHLMPEDKNTSTQYGEEVKQGLIGIGEGLMSFFTKDQPKKPEFTISPDVLKQNDQQVQFNRIIDNLIQTESSGKHTTSTGELLTSSEGAKGLTQVMPATAKNPGYGIKPIQNDSQEEYVRFTKDYLGKMMQIFDNQEQAVAAYNAGPGSIHRAIAKSQRTGRDWKEFIPKETQQYIQKVIPSDSTSQKLRPEPRPPLNVTDAMGTRG